MIFDFFGWILIYGGCYFIISSAVGCLRFSDFFSRLHAAGIGDSCGTSMILLGLIFKQGLDLTSVKLACLFLLLLITGPVASYSLAKSWFKNLNKHQDQE